jgi:hypothetical protein
MNNSTNAPKNPNELVLRLIGGERDGQLFTVEKEKCLLSDLSPSIADAENYRCVIFRGEKGVAFRSYSDHVLCNGAKVSVQWLKKGDLIKVTDNFSVEVYQLGVYAKKPATASPALRAPVNTVEFSNTATAATPVKTGGTTHPASPTTTTASPAVDTPAASLSPSATPPANYAKPSVQFPSISAAATTQAPEFKPATQNFRTPAVTAPLATHQIPTEPPAPAPSVSPMPLSTQAIDLEAAVASPEKEAANESLTSQLPPTPAAQPFEGVPSAPTNATIDSLSERLSKLVDSAGKEGISELESEDTAPPDTPSSTETPASTEGVQPEPVVATASPAGPDATDALNAAAVDGHGSTADTTQPTAADEAAKRRSALEAYFSKSGVELSDSIAPPADQSPPSNAAVPEAAPVTSAQSAAADAPWTPAENPVAPTDTAPQTMATEQVTPTPEFNLDSVLANLESGSSDSMSQTPTVEPAPEQQSPVATVEVAQPTVVDTSVVDTPVVDTPVVQTPLIETATVVEGENEATENEATDGDQTAQGDQAEQEKQGGQLESFALLQSLGLDTSGLGQIKQELTEEPSIAEVEAISLDVPQPAAPETPEPEPEKVESVADVLARMQSAGSLEDFKAAEEEADSSTAEALERVTPTPPPAAPPVTTAASSPVSSDAGGSGSDDDGSVEDYMSQLLNRMRGDSEPTSGEVTRQKQDEAVEKIAALQEANAAQSQPAKPGKLTPEEFVPKQKAVRMQSLDSLREIANKSAREAFRDSLAKERKVSTQTKMALSMVSLAFAVLFFIMSYMKQPVNFWGVVFGIGFLIVGLLTARAYLSERKLDRSILSD